MTLADLKPGQRAIIAEFNTYVPPIKLLELGCLPGCDVELIQIAPFKDPIYFNVNGSHLAIRKAEAAQIEIHPVNGTDAHE